MKSKIEHKTSGHKYWLHPELLNLGAERGWVLEMKKVKCDCGNDTVEVIYSDGLKARHCKKCDIDFVIRKDGTIKVIA